MHLAKSFELAIVGAEYILRWLPRGEGLRIDHMTGMAFNPMNGAWRLDDKDLDVNYLPAAAKPV